jgi:uncharacterized membrane protein YbhN (UPF0104 family)
LRFWRAIRWPAGIALGVGLSWLLLREIDPADVLAHLAGANPAWIGVGLGCIAGTLVAKSLRWRSLFPRASAVRFWDLLGALLVGQLVNTAVPVRMGEVARASSLAGERPSHAYTFATIVAEKLIDGVLLGLLALAALSLAPAPTGLRRSAAILVAISLALLLAWLVAAAARGERLLDRLADGRLAGLARHGREPMAVIRRLPKGRVLLRLVAWSLVAFGLGALANYACLRALSLEIDWTAALAVLVIGQLGGAVPTSPGRIGVFQGLCVAALAPYAVTREAAISFGILLYILAILLPCLGGFSYLVALRHRRPAPEPPAGGATLGADTSLPSE